MLSKSWLMIERNRSKQRQFLVVANLRENASALDDDLTLLGAQLLAPTGAGHNREIDTELTLERLLS
jgi:hypothetical protein